MKIHSDILTEADVHRAARSHGMHGVYAEVDMCGSRSRRHGLTVHLTGTSNRRPNRGTSKDRGWGDDEYAATWDEWGMVIAALFEIDPNAIIGRYRSRDMFNAFTHHRFDALTASYQCANHKWEYRRDAHLHQCAKCGAKTSYDVFIAA